MKYKEYHARTEFERVQLDILKTLDEIKELLKPNQKEEIIVTPVKKTKPKK